MQETPIPVAKTVVRLHDDATAQWHLPDGATVSAGGGFEEMLLAQHRENFDLWHEEDEARDPGATDTRIAAVKHAIDRINQKRNDLVEAMDDAFTKTLIMREEASLHSETPGMMIDRMSIMALKIYHTQEETVRASASEVHRQKNLSRLAVLREQRTDLGRCFDELMTDIREGRKRFKIYRQMKMYNDPELNPVLYGQAAK